MPRLLAVLALLGSFATHAWAQIYLPGAGRGNCFMGNRPAMLKTVGSPLPACRGASLAH